MNEWMNENENVLYIFSFYLYGQIFDTTDNGYENKSHATIKRLNSITGSMINFIYEAIVFVLSPAVCCLNFWCQNVSLHSTRYNIEFRNFKTGWIFFFVFRFMLRNN